MNGGTLPAMFLGQASDDRFNEDIRLSPRRYRQQKVSFMLLSEWSIYLDDSNDLAIQLRLSA